MNCPPQSAISTPPGPRRFISGNREGFDRPIAPYCQRVALMKKTLLVGAALCAIASPLLPQTQVAGGTIITPQSSIARPQDLGVRAHTFIHIFIPAGGLPVKAPAPIEGAANTTGGCFH